MAEPVRRELKIPNETRFLAALREAVREVATESGFPEGEFDRLMLAVDESVTNVMEHAYENDLEGEMTIEVSLEATDSRFIAHVRDRGTPFDPTAIPAPDLSAHLDEGRRHGLGIFLIRQIMDEVTYTSKPDGWNELCLVKRVLQTAGLERAGTGKRAVGARGLEEAERLSGSTDPTAAGAAGRDRDLAEVSPKSSEQQQQQKQQEQKQKKQEKKKKQQKQKKQKKKSKPGAKRRRSGGKKGKASSRRDRR